MPVICYENFAGSGEYRGYSFNLNPVMLFVPPVKVSIVELLFENTIQQALFEERRLQIYAVDCLRFCFPDL